MLNALTMESLPDSPFVSLGFMKILCKDFEKLMGVFTGCFAQNPDLSVDFFNTTIESA